jgi:NADPH:quinone reductase-like Zn-dependent oxidoreductase
MRAAVLSSYGTPTYGEFPDPDGDDVVDVLAAGLNGVDVIIASGTHYFSPPELPVVSGWDGVGRTADGRRVYFSRPPLPYGSMAERAPIVPAAVLPVPDGVSDEVAAALGNAGMAAWMPLANSGRLAAGETVLVLGATGVVGRLAVQSARLLGAGTVIAAGRDTDRLAELRDLGADRTVVLGEDDLAGAVRAAGGVDVIVDYVWGQPAATALTAGKPGVRLVHVGDRAGADASVPGALIRSLGATITGFLPIWLGAAAVADAYRRLGEAAAAGHLDVPTEAVPLADVAAAWARYPGTRHKLVLVP